ncbi:MAG: class I SAM-dependent methyltransferase [Actinobacteria bacterium]|nr:MAG: class I SAM-dependent methyltransferase [Actinomycetota bacterium]
MSDYWNERFKGEGRIWGDEPSPSAMAAARLFQVWEVSRVLVPGCGYGRHCAYFAKEGFEVVGIDTSSVALKLAGELAAERKAEVELVEGDATAIPLSPGEVDAVYDRALLHLLSASERGKAISEYHRVLRPDGIVFLSCFSTEDDECGEGPEVEPGTFDAKGGRPAHFFTEDELRREFEAQGFHVSVVRTIVEYEEHGDDGGHYHKFWQLIAEKE